MTAIRQENLCETSFTASTIMKSHQTHLINNSLRFVDAIVLAQFDKIKWHWRLREYLYFPVIGATSQISTDLKKKSAGRSVSWSHSWVCIAPSLSNMFIQKIKEINNKKQCRKWSAHSLVCRAPFSTCYSSGNVLQNHLMEPKLRHNNLLAPWLS